MTLRSRDFSVVRFGMAIVISESVVEIGSGDMSTRPTERHSV